MAVINNDYKYLMESKVNSYVSLEDIRDNPYNTDDLLNIICYHITDNTKYPFIQFLLHKVPFCKGIATEEFVLPVVSLLTKTDTIESVVINCIKGNLTSLGIDTTNIDTNAYKGILTDIFDEQYAFIDISAINISPLPLISRSCILWFALPSEIINIGKICNINISDRLKELFIYMPELGILHTSDTTKTIPLPYSAYTGSTVKKISFQSIFGCPKRKVYDTCSEYYFFHKSFDKAVKEGGWSSKGGNCLIDMNDVTQTHSNSGEMIIDNEYGRYIKGGINRYAIFATYDTTVHTEETTDATITDQIINEYGQTIFISFKKGSTNYKPNVLVKEYDSFLPLSHHILDKRLLKSEYNIENADTYMIS